MRILCLSLKKTSNVALADVFLKFSPRVQFRKPNLLFIDITSTTTLFGSEAALLSECEALCELLGLEAHVAIADTPWGAQLLSHCFKRWVSPPGEECESLAPLPIDSLIALEGLKPWPCGPTPIMQMASFLEMMGFSTLQHLYPLSQASFQERWGEVGVLVWRRLHGLEKQFISPWVPEEPLHFYQYLDFPITLASFLLKALEKPLTFLFARLQGRNLFARKLQLTLRMEYSSPEQILMIEPASASRDLSLFLVLLEQKLERCEFANPIREFEIDIVPCEEKPRQLDFWDPQNSDQEKLQRLMSLLQQSRCQCGFYQMRSAVLPEKTWVLESSPAYAQAFEPIDDEVLSEGEAYAVRRAYGKSVLHAPRPTRLLLKPQPLHLRSIQSLKLLSRTPIERLEDQWWQSLEQRDYYFAISAEGQCLWIYQDRTTNAYFLHGYFD